LFWASWVSLSAETPKVVAASAVNEKGEEIYPVKWNHDFMDLPEGKDQRTPTFTAEQISTIISKAEGPYQVLYALLAGTGLRIEEAFARQVEDIEGSVIRVRHRMWKGELLLAEDNGRRPRGGHHELAKLSCCTITSTDVALGSSSARQQQPRWLAQTCCGGATPIRNRGVHRGGHGS
jgi:hypothetical protein